MTRICKAKQGVGLNAGVTSSDTDSRICLPKMGVGLTGEKSGRIIIFPTAGKVSFPGAGQIIFP